MTKIIDIMLKKRSCWLNMTIQTQNIAFINEQFLIMVAIFMTPLLASDAYLRWVTTFKLKVRLD